MQTLRDKLRVEFDWIQERWTRLTNAEKLQKTMEEASKRFQSAPEYLKRESSRPQSASIYRTIQPKGDTKKR